MGNMTCNTSIPKLNGGAIVQYYLLNKMRYLMPKHDFYGIPKTPRLLRSDEMPYVRFFMDEATPDYVASVMFDHNIPLMVAFHIADQIEPYINPVHAVGGRILMHQTVHFPTDKLFDCKRLNDVDWITSPTEYGRQTLCNIAKVPQNITNVIPHGVDTDKYYRHQTAFRKNWGLEDKIVILFTGRLSMWKGAHTIVPLFRDFTKGYNCTFIIRAQPNLDIAESKKLDYIYTTIASRNKDVIYIPDWQSPAVMEEIFASSDILLSPTGSEGFNMPLIEAMACEMPVITTSLPNHLEILGRDTALFVKPKIITGWADKHTQLKVPSSNDLYDALKYLVENPEEMKIMGELGRGRAVEKYDLTKIANKWIQLMTDLIPEIYSMINEMGRRLNV